MCGRYTLIANAEAIRLLFQVPPFDVRLVPPRYNIAPTQPVIVVREGHGGRELVPMRWGLIPSWAKDPAELSLLILARADGIADKPAFRHAFRRRRCLFPASGFYEWQARGRGPRQPYAVRPAKSDLLAFAGIWETWFGNDGSEIDTAAIVTTDANAAMRTIHERMPVIVDPRDFETWLSGDTDPADAAKLLRPPPDDSVTATRVSMRVNAVANDDAGLLEPMPEDRELAVDEPAQGRLF